MDSPEIMRGVGYNNCYMWMVGFRGIVFMGYNIFNCCLWCA